MNILRLKESTDEEVVYTYQPEGRDGLGEIKLDLKTGEAEILKIAPEDQRGYYARMAWGRLKKQYKEGNLPKQFTQAWY